MHGHSNIKSVFTALHGEEFGFVGAISILFGNVISQFPVQMFLIYIIVLVIVE